MSMSQDVDGDKKADMPKQRRMSKWLIFAVSLIVILLASGVIVLVSTGKLSLVESQPDTSRPTTGQKAASPTIESRELRQANSQNGFTVSITRIERAKEQTRVFVTIENAGTHTVSMYDDSTYLIQGSTKLKPLRSDAPDDRRVHSGAYPPKVKSSGLIIYPAIASLESVMFYAMAPYSNTRDLDWRDMTLPLSAP